MDPTTNRVPTSYVWYGFVSGKVGEEGRLLRHSGRETLLFTVVKTVIINIVVDAIDIKYLTNVPHVRWLVYFHECYMIYGAIWKLFLMQRIKKIIKSFRYTILRN